MKTVITLNTSGYEVEEKSISKIKVTDTFNGFTGKTQSGQNFTVFGNKNSEYTITVKNPVNDIELNFSNISEVKSWLTKNI